MLFHTYGQFQAFVLMAYAGLAIGALKSAVDLVRRLTQAGRLLTCVLDAIFALGMAALLTLGMIAANLGQVRLYCLLGALCGAALYHFTLAPLARLALVRPAQKIFSLLGRMGRWKVVKKIFR